jgi:predicted aspartyl protease
MAKLYETTTFDAIMLKESIVRRVACAILNDLKIGHRIFCKFAVMGALLVGLLPTATANDADDLQQAVRLFNAKNFKASASLFSRLTQSSKSPTPSYYLALCYQKLNAERAAQELYARICKQWPGTSEARLAKEYLNNVASVIAKEAPTRMEVENNDLSADPVLSQQEWDRLPLRTKIPYSKENGHMMVNAKINGKYCKVIFDTGATLCGISKRDFPNVVASLDLANGTPAYTRRPAGMAPVWECMADISLQDISRNLRLQVIDEPDVTTIGQNFFPEYSYQIDDFYIRLTKSPHRLQADAKQLTVVKDKYSIPFELFQNLMLVEIEVNGKTIKAIFDTGCAANGLVYPSSEFENLGLKIKNPFPLAGVTPGPDRAFANKVAIGPVTKFEVRAYPAEGLIYTLIGPKLFDRPYSVDQVAKIIRFDY